MTIHNPIIRAIKWFGGSVLTIGLILFAIGFLLSGFTSLIPIGIGAAAGAALIFIIGIFFVVTEEMLQKSARRS